jgi:hypothetical protein
MTVKLRLLENGRRESLDGRWSITRQYREVQGPRAPFPRQVAEWLLEDTTGHTEPILCDRLGAARDEIDRRLARQDRAL